MRMVAAVLLTLCGRMAPLCHADDKPVVVKPDIKVVPAETSPKVGSAGPKGLDERNVTPDDISRVYMNCLIEVDRTMAALARHAKNQAVRTEAESQRAFCANRKRDCQERPRSAECRTFVEEFMDSGITSDGASRP